MGKVEYVCIGEVTCVRRTDKAAMIEMDDGVKHWIPFSEMDVPTLSDCEAGNVIEKFRCAPWICDARGIDYADHIDEPEETDECPN